jgi:hypothetical protein
MTAQTTIPRTAHDPGHESARGGRARVVGALAAAELRRTVRNPVLYLGAGLSLWLMREIHPLSEDWSGASYEGMAMAPVGLVWGISVVAAVSFHRERTPVALDAPVPGHVRIVSRFAAALPLIVLSGAFAGLVAWRQRALGGLPLGTEPGRTTEALFSLPELLQPVALGVLAVSLGAALGRRMPHPVGAVPVLFVFWYAAGVFYWLYGHPSATPFSVFQVQPLTIPVGPADADPFAFPASWLLEGPGDYQDGWARKFVSEPLAWWHDGWLVGLSLLLVATVVPERRARRVLLAAGVALAVVSALAQVRVIP